MAARMRRRGCAEVEVDDEVEGGGVGLFEGGAEGLGGVVDDAIDAGEFLEGGLDQLLGAFGVGEVVDDEGWRSGGRGH